MSRFSYDRCRAFRRLGGRIFAVSLAISGWSFGWLIGVNSSKGEQGQTVQGQTVPAVEFESAILPLLQSRCAECHGADSTAEGGFRFTSRQQLLSRGDSGQRIVEPHNSAASELLRRLTTTDPDLQMPPDGERLSSSEVQQVQKWIDQGASWQRAEEPRRDHWAYQPIRRTVISAAISATESNWCRNPIDQFVLRRMKTRGLEPTAAADPALLIRRVYLDLIGLPPHPDVVDRFVADPSDLSYRQIVEDLLASPRYGEKWARQWLDLARYSDSNGYQADQLREFWAYRDWVIDAMNDDMPFDQFTIDQLAGDLLPESSLRQKIATGFHRATTCNVEAGVDPEQNRVNQVIDRVNTTGTVWLGTTLECAQCHNHKYDPISQEEYYQLFAFFNNTPIEVKQEAANSVQFNFDGPEVSLPLDPDQATRREARLADLARVTQLVESRRSAVDATLDSWIEKVRSDTSQLSRLPKSVVTSLGKSEQSPADRNVLQQHLRQSDDQLKSLLQRQTDMRKRVEETEPATTLVMQEMSQPRNTTMFVRGEYLQPGASVEANTPAIFPPMPRGAGADRLALARWLTDPQNPLVARVAVNRWWSELFGRGIVATVDDFGSQGAQPTHPLLLDWLASEFQDGWSMKHIHRLIVTSSTYRQSSRIDVKSRRQDPLNDWLSRSPRLRLPAELIRDNALVISGGLANTMHGAPVFPPQPDGVWHQIGRNEPVYQTDIGTDRMRRGIYVVWRRAAPYPSFVNFDAPDRMKCVADRPKTNTPIQALTLLNDATYVELAGLLANRVINESPSADLNQRLRFALKLCVARAPLDHEIGVLRRLYRQQRERFESDQAAAQQLIASAAPPARGKQPTGDAALPAQQANPQVNSQLNATTAADTAAWICVCNALLNLDETITRP